MNLPTNDSQSYKFVQGAGEMGELTRNFDWAATSLGPISDWPLSLKTTVGIVLHSAFPMFLFWGKELFCFYNNAYRPSLGIDGKHPAVGKVAKDVWPDIWDFIGPLIEKVMIGEEAVYFEDQLLPIYRNGKMEEAYWSFSYSPAYGENGSVAGVFVTCNETTQKVYTVNKLFESEKLFQALLRESPMGIILLEGKDAVVKLVNEAYGRLVDRSVSQLLNQPLFSVVPESEQYFREMIDGVRNTGEPFYLYDHPYYVSQDGGNKEGFLNLVYQAYGDDAEHISGVMALVQDVTEQVVARKKLEEKEQQVRSLIAGAPFPIGVYEGKEMRIVLANQSIIDVWGKGNDVIGKTYAEVLPELGNQAIYPQLDGVLMTGVPYHARNQRVDLHVDGRMQPFYFNYSFTPLYDASGNIYGVMNTAAEVTDLHLAKQKVEQSEQNLRNMILQAPVAMCILLGPNYTVDVANQSMIELWGKSAEEVLNRPVFEGVPDVSAQGLETLLAEVYTTGNTVKASERPLNIRHNGKLEMFYLNFVYEPYRDGVGNILGVLAVAIDVTQQVLARIRIEETVAERTLELATANNNLQRSNDELAQFAYIASHDLQEPLRKVRSFAEMLEQTIGEDGITEKTKSYLDKINSSTTRMAVLIRDVLAYSQLARDQVIFEPVDLRQTVSDIQADLELLIEQKRANIVTINLPVIHAIPLQMSQLFANLLSNALKFSKPGEAPYVRIHAEKAGPDTVLPMGITVRGTDYYRITIEDNGIGFDGAYADKIFNIFQRLHGKADYGGTGIGLAICKKIAQNHGGDIFASSVVGQGALFTLILPRDGGKSTA